MSVGYRFQKAVADVLDYTLPWSSDLAAGETITTAVWTAETGITVDSYSNTDTTTTVWLSGGTDGNTYLVFCTMTTSAGKTLKRFLEIVVNEKVHA